ncbi:MAG: GNAT family N-acetyltransferase [Lawsonibacter sp.]|nr:GNAT family N-acetyltransferase [Lawsonibacter sp.]
MINVRPSIPADIPAQRELWKLAFGDSGDYVDNFYTTYYRPERVLVLEEDGVVRSMTAWFDTALVLPGRGEYRAAYLYAVATHPDCRGRGLAAKLLSAADAHFQFLGIPAVTTVPAEPSLHRFFGANGFREYFTHDQMVWKTEDAEPLTSPFRLQPLEPEEYGRLRETILAETPHIAFPVDALAYQAGCCRLSGGGLYAAKTAAGMAVLCAEGMEDGSLMLKELVGCPSARGQVLSGLRPLLPRFGGRYRTPGEQTKFGMLKWLDKEFCAGWDWASTAYLGLGFD